MLEPPSDRYLWFLNTLVFIRVSEHDGSDGISVLEHQAPKGDSPPAHVHVNEDEVFHVIEGEFRFRLGERDFRARAGDTLLAPKGVSHTYRVESVAGGRWLTVTARGDFERFVRALSRAAAREALPEPSGPPTPEAVRALAAKAREFGIEIVGPPLQA